MNTRTIKALHEKFEQYFDGAITEEELTNKIINACRIADQEKAANRTSVTKSWKRAYSIERCYVSCITDAGMEETYDENYKRIDSDDLRIAVELIDSSKVLLDMAHSRIRLTEDDLIIEYLTDNREDGLSDEPKPLTPKQEAVKFILELPKAEREALLAELAR